MAYALAPYLCKLKLCRIDLPEDVAELIDGMLDWRYELVQGGGKTPSASCVNPIPPREPGGMMTDHMDTRKEYIHVLCMPEFQLHSQSNVPNSELHPDSRRGWGQTPAKIILWVYALKQPRFPGEDTEPHRQPGERTWKNVREWPADSFQVKHRARIGGA